MPSTKPTYAGKVQIRRAVEAVRSLGMNVAGIEIKPDGTIKIIDKTAIELSPKDEFEAWDRNGKLG